MRVILLFVLLIATKIVFCQTIEIGEMVPTFQIELVDEQNEIFHFNPSDGNVVLIDFWATWCAPCIKAMPHMEALQKEFKGQLKVLAVSDEASERISRFKQNRPYAFMHARDTGNLRGLFPHRVIPHSVLIGPAGKLIAVTSPENITAEVVKNAINGNIVDLPIKRDYTEFDLGKEYFTFDTEDNYSFQLQPYNPGMPSFSRSYQEGDFAERRLTIFNLNIPGLYRIVHDISSYRLIYEFDKSLVDWEDEKNRYCLNVITPTAAELHPYAQEQIENYTGVVARKDKRPMEVLVISKIDQGIHADIASVNGMTDARGDGFTNTGATIGQFCEYLENFGIVGMPVVDNTQDKQLYNIDFSFDPENSESLKKAMSALGLKFEKKEIITDVLLLSIKEDNIFTSKALDK